MWTYADILSIRPQGTYFNEIFIWNSNIFIQENALEEVVCEMAAILSRGDELMYGFNGYSKFVISHLVHKRIIDWSTEAASQRLIIT